MTDSNSQYNLTHLDCRTLPPNLYKANDYLRQLDRHMLFACLRRWTVHRGRAAVPTHIIPLESQYYRSEVHRSVPFLQTIWGIEYCW